MFTTDSYSAAMASVSADTPVRCVKIKRTQTHCPNRRVERVCVSRNDVHNFFKGEKLPMEMR